MPAFHRVHALLRYAAAALLCLALGSHAATLRLTDADAVGVQAAVKGQLAALAANDAKRAFSFAAPNVRERVVTAQRFMQMVRAGYPLLLQPSHVHLLVPHRLPDGTAVQQAQMQDARGDSWLVTYTLRQQKDRAWRISGCDIQVYKSRGA